MPKKKVRSRIINFLIDYDKISQDLCISSRYRLIKKWWYYCSDSLLQRLVFTP